MLRQIVESNYISGMKIYDLGCGSTYWNQGKLPVTGVDFYKATLDYAMEHGRLTDYICQDLNKIELEVKADMIILGNVLEHLSDYDALIEKVHSLLNVGGYVVVDVPYDTWDSVWLPLFRFQCFIEGTLRGKEIWKNYCGHVNSFSPKRMKKILQGHGFIITEQKSNYRMNFVTVARKTA